MSQFDLFKGKRQRGVRPPPPHEIKLHIWIAQLLGRWSRHTWRWTHFPAGEVRDVVTAVKLNRMGLAPGWPDFLFIAPEGGGTRMLEVKRYGKGLRLSDAQQDIANAAEEGGIPYAVVDSDKAALAVLRHWGVLRVNIREVA